MSVFQLASANSSPHPTPLPPTKKKRRKTEKIKKNTIIVTFFMRNKLVITAYFTTIIMKIINGLEKSFQRTPVINDSLVNSQKCKLVLN